MSIKEKFFKEEKIKGLTASELITLIYVGITTVLTLIYWDNIEGPWEWLQHCPALDGPQDLIFTRALVLLSIGFFYLAYKWKPCKATIIIRSALHTFYLIFWYTEGYQFVRQLPYLDHIFAKWEWALFGCQPSLEFAKAVPNTFICEYLNLGYYSYYYLMIGVVMFYIFCRKNNEAQRATFIYLASFFIYYLFFFFVPTAGPYYYFHAIGTDVAASGIYPDLGNYFATHSDMMHQVVRGPFSQMVVNVEEFGETPMGAFPSSHVSMSTVSMILAWKSRNKWLFWIFMPLYIPLCISTVYISAHYAVDAFAGFISAFLLVWTLWKLSPWK